MEYEESIRVLSTLARRVQVLEKQLHDLYWDVDQYVQRLMESEVKKQQEAEKVEVEKAKGKKTVKTVEVKDPKANSSVRSE